VLVCTLVSVREPKPPGEGGPPPVHPPLEVPKPEPTRDEYLASLREARSRCLVANMRTAGLAPTVSVCQFKDGSHEVCTSGLEKLTRNLTDLNPDELERDSQLELLIQLRAVTELNGSFGTQARQALARGQEALRAVPLWSKRLRDQSYQERPRLDGGALYFDVTYRLRSMEQQEVERQWDDRQYAALEQRRKLARACETQ
jgi:hypothetical protein